RAAPVQVPGFTASDDTYCTHVALLLTDVANETGYVILRGSAPYDSVAADMTTYNDNNAVAGTQYTYQVRGKNDCGYGTASAGDNGRRKAPPGQVTGVQASDGEHCWGVRVTWTTLTADSFQINRDGTRIGATLSGIIAYDDSTALPGIPYDFSVIAFNMCGSGIESSVNQGSRGYAPPVTGVTATMDDCFQCVIEWNDIADEDSFVVFRNGIRIGATAPDQTTFTDVTGTQGIVYSYTIIVWQGACESMPSIPASGRRLGPPPSPSGLSASTDQCDRIIISWTDVDQDMGYLIRRNGQFLAFVDRDTTHYEDSPSYGIKSYTVQAINECGAGVAAGPVSGQRMTVPSITLDTVLVSCQEIVLEWTASSETDWTRIFRNGILFDSIAAPQNSFVITETVAGEYLFTVAAANECGASEFSDTLLATIASFPQSPSSVEFTDNGCDSLTVLWTNGGGSFAFFRVFRDSVLMATIPQSETSWVDTDVIIGESYTYWVSAFSDTCGASDPSAPIVATISNSEPLATPELLIIAQGQNAVLTWGAIDETTNGCPAMTSGYLVFYSPEAAGPYYYHGFTTDTSYVHTRVIQFAEGMNYQIVAYAGPLARIANIERGTPMDELISLPNPK
ncbi:MAG: fibronectin type III domain-containing protein, partial [bacterium]|nr:fibronectin type III domain-containing protein [bacterium]